jgi:hypothetical protein
MTNVNFKFCFILDSIKKYDAIKKMYKSKNCCTDFKLIKIGKKNKMI